jgi:hypothetical protein
MAAKSFDGLRKKKKKEEKNPVDNSLRIKTNNISETFPPLDGEKIDVKFLYGNIFRVNYWRRKNPDKPFSDNIISRSLMMRSTTEQIQKGSITKSVEITEQESIDSMKE